MDYDDLFSILECLVVAGNQNALLADTTFLELGDLLGCLPAPFLRVIVGVSHNIDPLHPVYAVSSPPGKTVYVSDQPSAVLLEQLDPVQCPSFMSV